MTWSKADLRRMQDGLDRMLDLANRNNLFELTDEYRERVNAALSSNVPEIVRAHLRWLVHCVETNPRMAAEGRAATRLLARLDVEPLPRELLAEPRLVLRREVDAEIDDLARRETERQILASAVAAVPLYQTDRARDLRVIEANLVDLVSRGEVKIVRASSEAFGTDTTWSDFRPLVSWREWARPAAVRRGAASGWDRCTCEAVKLETNATPLAVLWSAACDEETLPDVLDLRGTPASHGMLVERWAGALASALRRSTRGIVLVFDGHADVLARVLPHRVG